MPNNLIHEHLARTIPIMQRHTHSRQIRVFLHPNYQAVLENGLMTAIISLPKQLTLRYAEWVNGQLHFNPRIIPHLADTKHYPVLDVQNDFELTYTEYLGQLAPWTVTVTPLIIEEHLQQVFDNTGDLEFLRGLYV